MYNPQIPVHGKLLRVIYQKFGASDEWPLARPLAIELSDDLDPLHGLAAVCRDIGDEFVLCENLSSETARVRLRLKGLTLCGDSGQRDVQNFLAIARLAAAKYRAADGIKADLRFEECETRLGMSPADAKRAWLIMQMEVRFSSGGGQDVIYLNPFAGQLRDVASADEYYERASRYTKQEIEDNRPPIWTAARPLNERHAYFVSHAAADATLARLLGACLERADPDGFVFVASRPGDISVGEDWLRIIRDKLKAATTYVVLLTPNSITRPWIWFETGAAWMSGNRLIPLVAQGLRKGDVPSPLNAHQLIDLSVTEEASQMLKELGPTVIHDATVRELVAMAGYQLEAAGTVA